MYITDKHYSTISPFAVGSTDLAISNEDIERLKAYIAYEDFYHNRPETLVVKMRGDSEPIYLPSTKKCIEATNRFLAVAYNYTVATSLGSPIEQAAAQMYMGNLFKREEVLGKFSMQRRYGLIRGDAVWHITADDTKDPGKRISVHTVHPSNYFPIEDELNPGRILGVHLVDKIQDPRAPDDKTKKVIRRQTYRRTLDANGSPTGEITSEVTRWEIGGWDDRNQKPADLKPLGTILPVTALPPQITSIPVYHIRNSPLPDVIFGMSQVQGVETLVNGMNQAITDEDLTLVMQGLGMYFTTAGAPQNADGTPAAWNLGPGQVVEIGEGQSFGRVTGVSSVAPFVEHNTFIDNYMQQGLGIPDIAAGRVDVAVAESGISLKLQLAPILAANAEKEQEILGRMDHMLWDISTMWMSAYEQITFSAGIEVVSVVDDPMPVNRDSKIQEILLLQTSGLITIAQAQAELAKLGYNFVEGDDVKVVQEAQALALARSGDPFNNRYGEEVEPQSEGAPTVGQAAKVAAPSAAVSAPTVNGL